MGQDGTKMGQDGAKMAQDGAKMGQDGTKLEPRWSQDGPGWSQDGSRWSQDGPRWSQEGPRWSQDGANKPAPEQEECTVARVTAAAILHALNVTDQEQHDARRGFLGMSCAELVTLKYFTDFYRFL